MKITKQYLKQIIKESIEEAQTSLSSAQAGSLEAVIGLIGNLNNEQIKNFINVMGTSTDLNTFAKNAILALQQIGAMTQPAAVAKKTPPPLPKKV